MLRLRPMAVIAMSIAAMTFTVRAAEPAVAPEPYFRHAEFADARISPSGRMLVAIAPVNGRRGLVPVDHGVRLRNALRAQGTPVEWLEFPEEGHGIHVDVNRFTLYERVAKFLAEPRN